MTPIEARHLIKKAENFIQNVINSHGISFIKQIMTVALLFWHFWDIQEYIFTDIAAATELERDFCCTIALAIFAISSE